MATARIAQQFPDGTAFEVEIDVDENYPDAVHEVRAQALGLWRDAFVADDESAE